MTQQVILNGIVFNNVNKDNAVNISAKLKQINLNINSSNAIQQYMNSNKYFNVVDAIDINWNGAEVEDGVVINTTGELLNWIKNKNNIEDLQINGESKGNSGIIDLGNYLTEHPENGEKFLSFGSINDNVKRILIGLSIDKNGHIVYGKEISIQSLAQEVAKYITFQNNNIYMISFKDGDEIISNISGITGTSINIPENPTKEGYEFVGWNRDINAIEAEDVINQIGNENITYYAIWKEKYIDYKLYIGVEQLTVDNFNNEFSNGIIHNTYNSSSAPAQFNYTTPTDTYGLYYVAYPKSWGTINIQTGAFANAIDDINIISIDNIEYYVKSTGLVESTYTIWFT